MYPAFAFHPQARNIAVSFAKMPDPQKPKSLAIADIRLAPESPQSNYTHVAADTSTAWSFNLRLRQSDLLALGRFLVRHLCALLARLGKTNGDCLLPARYLPAFTALTGT
jgi:hypothetical protein